MTCIRRPSTASRRQVLGRLGGALASLALAACAPTIRPPVPPRATETATSVPVLPPSPLAAPSAVATAEPTIVPTAAPPTSTATPVPRTITWWTERSDPAWLKAVAEAGRRFSAIHPEATVESSGGHADFGRTVGSIAIGLAPDLLETGSLGPLAARGVLRSLDPYLAGSQVSPGNYEPTMWDNGRWNGTVQGIPALDHGPELALFWNRSLAGDAIDPSHPPATWDELLRVGRSLTRNAADGSLTLLGFDPLDGVGALLDTVRDLTGQPWLSSNGSQVQLAQPAYQQHLDAVVAYCLTIGVDRLNDFRMHNVALTADAASAVNQGKQAALLTGYWSVAEVEPFAKDHQYDFRAAWAPAHQSGLLPQRLGGRLLVVPSAAHGPGDGWELLEFLTTDDVNDLFLGLAGRLAATRSYVSSGRWKRVAGLEFFLDSLSQATQLSARSNNPIAGYAQVKWEQVLSDVLTKGKSSAEALATAQATLQVALGKAGG
jgi:ABC-type glycerol-3-phosphate transport system substrate-binding protein